MPASASFPIRAALDQLTDVGLSDLVEVVPRREAPVEVADPRARRGVRHPLAVVLAAAVCAVAGRPGPRPTGS